MYKWINNSQLKQGAIMLKMIMSSLLLQKSSWTSKAKDHIECLKMMPAVMERS